MRAEKEAEACIRVKSTLYLPEGSPQPPWHHDRQLGSELNCYVHDVSYKLCSFWPLTQTNAHGSYLGADGHGDVASSSTREDLYAEHSYLKGMTGTWRRPQCRDERAWLPTCELRRSGSSSLRTEYPLDHYLTTLRGIGVWRIVAYRLRTPDGALRRVLVDAESAILAPPTHVRIPHWALRVSPLATQQPPLHGSAC